MARPLRDVFAEEGPAVASFMAQRLSERTPIVTSYDQRKKELIDLARESEFEQNDQILREQMRTNRELTERLAMEEEIRRQQMLAANPPGLHPPLMQEEVYQDGLGELTAEEAAVLSQMEADMANQPGDQGFTSPGFVPGGAGALPQSYSPPQIPIELGAEEATQQQPLQLQQPVGPQGFTSSTGYTSTPTSEGEQVDTVARNALDWVNNLFRSDPTVEGQEGATPMQPGPDLPNEQGFVNPTYQSSTPAGPLEAPPAGTPGGASTSSGIDTYTTQHGFGAKNYAQGGMTPEEQAKIDSITNELRSTRPDSNADSTRSGSFLTVTPLNESTSGAPLSLSLAGGAASAQLDQSPWPSIGGISGDTREVSAEEQNAAIVQSIVDELTAAGIEENTLRMFVDVDKFLSGQYNTSDVDNLMSIANRVGLPADIRARIQTMRDNVSGTSGHGFDSGGYSDSVAQNPGESFIEYTQRMHLENQKKNQWRDPDKAWVDPDA